MNNRVRQIDLHRAKSGDQQAQGRIALSVAGILVLRLRLRPADKQEAVLNIAEKVWCDGQTRGFARFRVPGRLICYYANDVRKLRKLAFPDKASKPSWRHEKSHRDFPPGNDGNGDMAILQRRRTSAIFESIDQASGAIDPNPSPLHVLEFQERRKLLNELLDRLPPDELTLVSHWMEGGPKLWSTIASDLGFVSASAAQSRFHRIIHRLRTMGKRTDFF